jgi:hypothetical protein
VRDSIIHFIFILIIIMKTVIVENESPTKTVKNANNYLTVMKECKRYRINIKDIKKLYKIEKKRVSPPSFETSKENYIPTAGSEA